MIASDVNYIILATPPGFRPAHLAAAIAAGKNIFTEKPVAVDGPGIRAVLAAYEQAKTKGLGIAAGTQRRHQTGYLEAMKRIHDGAIGKIVSARCYWNQGGLWKKDRQPEWTDAEWQLRNWLYFTWLSGDHIVEQHVHNIDVVNWAMNAHPVSANGMGGRQVRTGPDYGPHLRSLRDRLRVRERHAAGEPVPPDPGLREQRHGGAGRREGRRCRLDNSGRYAITGAKAWKFEGKDNRPYVQEHTDFIAAIRAGKPYNELKAVAESTLTAIMGRMSAYTGKVVTWDQALNSKEELMPANLTLGPLPTPPVPVPGQTPLAVTQAQAQGSWLWLSVVPWPRPADRGARSSTRGAATALATLRVRRAAHGHPCAARVCMRPIVPPRRRGRRTRASAASARSTMTLSDYRESSELMQVSRQIGRRAGAGQRRSVPRPATRRSGSRAASDGAFDVTVGPLSLLWREARRRQAPARSGAHRGRAGAGRAREAGTRRGDAGPCRLRVAGMQLDVGGIAKGFAADEAAAVLAQCGIRSALLPRAATSSSWRPRPARTAGAWRSHPSKAPTIRPPGT